MKFLWLKTLVAFTLKLNQEAHLPVQLAVTQAGQVGIGTTSPGYKLDVTGDSTSGVIAVRNSANGRDTFRSENAAGTRTVNIGNDANGHGIVLVRGAGGTTNNYIAGNGNSYFNAGNIGIGTTSPSHRLDIYSNENVPLRVHRPSNANLNSDGAWGIGFSTRGDAITSTTDTRAGIFSYYNGNLFLAAANTSIVADPIDYARLTVLNTGNVGIGTTSPAQKLTVSGNANVTVSLP